MKRYLPMVYILLIAAYVLLVTYVYCQLLKLVTNRVVQTYKTQIQYQIDMSK